MIHGKNRFVFVAPMYNASETLPRMLHSICGQSYTNWKVVLIDDVSDNTHQLNQYKTVCFFKQMIEDPESLGWGKSDVDHKIRVFWNTEKKWETANVLHGISMCEDDDIICRIDADDWLTDLDALAIIDATYQQTGCDALWTAHRWGFSDKNISGPMPDGVDPYVGYPWVSSHLKTFRKYLLNGVPYQNFLNMNGELVRRCGDQAIYLPVLYRAKKRQYLPRVLYHYHIDEQDGAIYQTDDAKFQKQEADFIRSRGYVKEGISWENYDVFVCKS